MKILKFPNYLVEGFRIDPWLCLANTPKFSEGKYFYGDNFGPTFMIPIYMIIIGLKHVQMN